MGFTLWWCFQLNWISIFSRFSDWSVHENKENQRHTHLQYHLPHEYHHLESPPFRPAPNIPPSLFTFLPSNASKIWNSHPQSKPSHPPSEQIQYDEYPMTLQPNHFQMEEPSQMLIWKDGLLGPTGTYKNSGWAPLKNSWIQQECPNWATITQAYYEIRRAIW